MIRRPDDVPEHWIYSFGAWEPPESVVLQATLEFLRENFGVEKEQNEQ